MFLVTNNVLSVKDFKHIHETYGYSYPPGRILKVFLCIVSTTLQSGVALQLTKAWLKPTRKPTVRETNVLVYPELEGFPEHISFIVKTGKALGKPERVGHLAKFIAKICVCCDTGILVGKKRPHGYC